MALVVGVVVFPGTNCERETLRAFQHIPNVEAIPLWHNERNLEGVDLVILPGGFSYGDYLRAGALARFSPIMEAIGDFAHSGGLVLGICNGFQILVEAHLLPGALLRNEHSRFVSRWVKIRVERNDLPWTHGFQVGEILRMPVAHGEGRYASADDPSFSPELVVFRYAREEGDEGANPNGSEQDIAGVVNPSLNVLGLMPHPERAFFPYHPSQDGRRFFAGILSWLESRIPAE